MARRTRAHRIGSSRLAHRAIAHHVRPAIARLQIAGEADAGLLDMAVAAGDGDRVGAPIRVGLEEGLFDHRGRELHRLVELAQHLRPVHPGPGFAREPVVVLRRKPRADPVLLPLVPGGPPGAEQIGLRPGHRRARARGRRSGNSSASRPRIAARARGRPSRNPRRIARRRARRLPARTSWATS